MSNYKNVSNKDDLQWKTTSRIKNERQPQIFKLKYLSNNWLDLSQILNVSFCEQKNVCNKDDLQWKTTSNIIIERQPQILKSKDNLKY